MSGVIHLIAGCIASVWTCFLVCSWLHTPCFCQWQFEITLYFVSVLRHHFHRPRHNVHCVWLCSVIYHRRVSFHFNLLQQEKRPVALRFSPFFWFCLYSQHQPWGGAAPRPSSHINRLLRTGCGCSDKQQYVSEFIPSSVLTSVSLYFLYSHSSECHSVLPAPLHFISSRILRSNDWRSASRVINMSNVELETNLDCISYNK